MTAAPAEQIQFIENMADGSEQETRHRPQPIFARRKTDTRVVLKKAS